MKTKIFIAFIATVIQLPATVSFNLQLGVARDMSGVAVQDGRLWVLVADTGSDGISGFTAGTTTGVTRLATSVAADGLFNVGQSLSIGGLIGGDTIFAMGAFNGNALFTIPGVVSNSISSYDYTSNPGVNESMGFAIYWFADTNYTGSGSITTAAHTQSIGSQVGGLRMANNDVPAGTLGMTLPLDGASPPTPLGAATSAVGGSITNAEFTAVAIPEPSAAILAMLGGLALLRRKRND